MLILGYNFCLFSAMPLTASIALNYAKRCS